MSVNSFLNLFENLTDQTLVLTPNARLQKVLQEQFDLSQTKPVWESPIIMPIKTWLSSLWSEAQFTSQEPLPYLLSDLEEASLWLQTIESFDNNLYATTNMAKEIQKAWTHCIQWQVDISEKYFLENEETQFFLKAVRKYQALCQQSISQNQLMAKLIPLIQNHQLDLPKSIICTFFDEVPPLLTAFFEGLQESGASLTFYEPVEVPQNTLYHAGFETPEAEIKGLIRWLKDETKSKENIGVVVTDLATRKNDIERMFKEYFADDAFNISYGAPLSEFPLVAVALTLLRLKKSVLTLDEVHLLLTNSYTFIDEKEHALRAQIYQRVHDSGEAKISRHDLLRWSKASQFHDQWDAMMKLDTSGTHPLNYWQSVFEKCLDIFGFPGTKALNSEEYQLHQRFFELFNTLHRLQSSIKPSTFNQALFWLNWVCQNTLFQAKASRAQIQILGFIEALGISFDKTWVLGTTHQALPQKANPSPFIPLHIQRSQNMPHASHMKEMAFAEQSIARLIKHSNEIIFSYYHSNDNEAFNASPLISTYPQINLSSTIPKAETILVPLTDSDNVHVKEESTLPGGSFLIKEQARCPFRAFSKYRLKLSEPRDNNHSLDELDRGNLVHLALEFLWHQLKSQRALLELDDDALNKLIESSASNAISEYKRKRPFTFNHTFIELEVDRLRKLLQLWLTIEKERPLFKVIDTESKQQIKIDNSEISVKIDRIDANEHNNKIVIDYKTGTPNISDWFQARPIEPQLPLYSLIDEGITTITFAQLKSKNLQLKGVGKEDNGLKGVKAIEQVNKQDWEQQRQDWLEQITAMIKEFKHGCIKAEPIKESICQSCGYKSLCGKLAESTT